MGVQNGGRQIYMAAPQLMEASLTSLDAKSYFVPALLSQLLIFQCFSFWAPCLVSRVINEEIHSADKVKLD